MPRDDRRISALTSAVIEVNKVKSLVTADSDFPASTDPNVPPVFHLKSVTAHTAKVSIAGGTYANGAPAITLQEGKPVTLMNTADGTRYTLLLEPQGTVVPTSTTQTSTTSTTSVVPSSGSGG